MSGSVNTVFLVGNLGRDPEIRSTQDGSRIANLNLATSESWKNKAGEKQERTEWHRICIFNEHIVDVCEKYLRKGSKLAIQGSLQTRKWTDQSGVEKYSTEIVISRFKGELTLLGDGKDGGQGQAAGSSNGAAGASNGNGGGWTPPPGLDDSIPFIAMVDIYDRTSRESF